VKRGGKIYFVAAPGRVKIGFTTNPQDRLDKLRHVDMEELSVIAIIDGTRKLERYLHDKAAPFRIKAEWFLDCAAVRNIIDECLSSKEKHVDDESFGSSSTLDEAQFVAEAGQLITKLILVERGRGATKQDALSLVAIKTGISRNRLWTFQYRAPKSATAAEIHSLRAIAGADCAAVGTAKALVGEDKK
jgi:hypothetical protein